MRALWTDKAPDVQAVAAHLEAAAKSATAPLQFESRPLGNADTKVLHQAALLRVRGQLKEAHTELDRILAQEVRAVDDLVRTANLMVERLREWYALHAPEATRMVADSERLATLVAEKGERGIVMAHLDAARAAQSSLGTDLDPADLRVLQSFAAALASVHNTWHQLELRIADLMKEVAPNLATVVGPVLGARMIAQAGSVARLASWPSGTIQTLGAETALFRHIKEGTLPPKHGLLFQHPLVHVAPQWQRGPVARLLALACTTAARADAFTKNDLSALLRAQVDEGLARIRKERARPPQRAPRPIGRGPPRAWPARPGPPRREASGGQPFAPRAGFSAGEPRRSPPAAGRWSGPPRDDRGPPRDDRGPRRDGPSRSGGFAPRGPGRGPPPSAGGSGWKPKRKTPGAFRRENKPARPPGRGDE